MNEAVQKSVVSVIEKTQSELILFTIVITLGLLLVILPLYRMAIKDRKDRQIQEDNSKKESQEHDIQRESNLLAVIRENSQVISGLKATLESTGLTTSQSFARIHDRLDIILSKEEKIYIEITEVKAMLNILISTRGDAEL